MSSVAGHACQERNASLNVLQGSAISGAVINFTGHYVHFLRFGPAITAIGGGLLYTIGEHIYSLATRYTSWAHYGF